MDELFSESDRGSYVPAPCGECGSAVVPRWHRRSSGTDTEAMWAATRICTNADCITHGTDAGTPAP